MNRIICNTTGSKGDVYAIREVFELLTSRTLPPGVEVLDCSAADFDLSRATQGASRLVIVDQVLRKCKPGEMMLIRDQDDVLAHFNHPGEKTGPVDFSLIPGLLDDGSGPEVVLVGLEPPLDETAIWRAAEKSLVLTERLDDTPELKKAQPWFTTGNTPLTSTLTKV